MQPSCSTGTDGRPGRPGTQTSRSNHRARGRTRRRRSNICAGRRSQTNHRAGRWRRDDRAGSAGYLDQRRVRG